MANDLLPNMAQSIKAYISREIEKSCPTIKHATVHSNIRGNMQVIVDGTQQPIPVFGNHPDIMEGLRVAVLKDKNNFYLIGVL